MALYEEYISTDEFIDAIKHLKLLTSSPVPEFIKIIEKENQSRIKAI